MPNPLNLLDWLKSAQDWFSKTEKSSGFRPFLIYLLLSIGAGIAILASFPTRPFLDLLALLLIGVPVATFVPLFAWKAHTDPDFCRSENHVQRIKKYELESMGTETKFIPGEVFEQQLLPPVKEPPQVGHDDHRGIEQ